MTATPAINAATRPLASGEQGPRALAKDCLGSGGLTSRYGTAGCFDAARNPRGVGHLTRVVRPNTFLAHPAHTVPLRTKDDLPTGLQSTGRTGDQARPCVLAALLAGGPQSDLVEEFQ